MDRVVEYTVRLKVPRIFPILSCWDNKMVAERKATEEKRGGFCGGRLVDRIPLPVSLPREFQSEPEQVAVLEQMALPTAPSFEVRELVDADENGSPVDSDCSPVAWYEPFIGRKEYPGKDKLQQEERDCIDKFLDSRTIGPIVWENDVCDVDAESFFVFLFGGMTSSRILDSFGDCLTRSRHVPAKPRVFVFPSFFQMDFSHNAKQLTRKTIIDESLIEKVVDEMSDSAVAWLNKIELQSFETLDYIISPIHTRNHWAVMIYKVQDRRFHLRDSLSMKQMKSKTTSFASFLSTYWAWKYDYKVKSHRVEVEYTRRQNDEGVDCGVHAGMSMERYIVGPTGRGSYLDDVEVDVYRASMVATILRDDLSAMRHLY